MKTLLLDTVTWDLTKDIHGNIAVADEPYAIAQDAASAMRLFLGELWYDTAKGVPYKEQILGQQVPVNVIKSHLIAAAKTVPGVVNAAVFLSNVTDRTFTGQVQVTTDTGVVLPVSGLFPFGVVPT